MNQACKLGSASHTIRVPQCQCIEALYKRSETQSSVWRIISGWNQLFPNGPRANTTRIFEAGGTEENCGTIKILDLFSRWHQGPKALTGAAQREAHYLGFDNQFLVAIPETLTSAWRRTRWPYLHRPEWCSVRPHPGCIARPRDTHMHRSLERVGA